MSLTTEQREWLTLTMVPGVGTAHFIRLLARFHSPGEVLRASRAALEETIGPSLAQRIGQYADAVDVGAQERAMERCGAQLISLDDPAYPLLLAEIYDPPLTLFIRGDLRESDANCVAVVGTRRATPYGIRMAEMLGRGLAARGVTVVSGMAAGIDAAAHRATIEAGGRTIAVLGCGADVVYPPQHEALMRDIIGHGCVMSQFPMGTQPSKGLFPYRNRIISGLCKGVVIVQAPLKSGALITARHAIDQGREVFAIPGEVGVLNSEGPHALIRDGAKLVETVDDILVELDVSAEVRLPQRPKVNASETEGRSAPEPARKQEAPRPAAKPDVPPLEANVLSALSPNGSYVDEIATACRISVSEALSSLTILELKGLVRQFSGKRFAPK